MRVEVENGSEKFECWLRHSRRKSVQRWRLVFGVIGVADDCLGWPQAGLGSSQFLEYDAQLLCLVIRLEQAVTHEKLHKNAAGRPNVDAGAVFALEQKLWTAIP